MTIKTKSTFYFVDGITSDNNYLNFIEPTKDNIELASQLQIGTYSMTQLATEIQRGMNDVGENEYVVNFDRDTRILSITGDATFDLLVTTGSNSGASIFGLIGFTTDKIGLLTYDGDTSFGSEYTTSYPFQNYKDFINNVQGIRPSINESASGVIEVVTFGQRSFMECNIKWVTNRDSFIGKGGTNLELTREFLDFAITKQNMEFMKDSSDRSTFDIVLLEKTRKSRDGTSYELNELIKQGLDEYYETGILTFRKVA
jgi:hypothetical protein